MSEPTDAEINEAVARCVFSLSLQVASGTDNAIASEKLGEGKVVAVVENDAAVVSVYYQSPGEARKHLYSVSSLEAVAFADGLLEQLGYTRAGSMPTNEGAMRAASVAVRKVLAGCPEWRQEFGDEHTIIAARVKGTQIDVYSQQYGAAPVLLFETRIADALELTDAMLSLQSPAGLSSHA